MRRALAPLIARASLIGAVTVAFAALTACASSADDEGPFAEDTVTVKPRVAIDGLIELSARTDGRVFVDEVVFHAPSVEVKNGPFAVADLLTTDPLEPGPLFFRYHLAEGGTHDAVAAERRWRLDTPGAEPSSNVVFGFAPLQATEPQLDELLATTGWDLSHLDGYTAYVHGYVSVDALALDLRAAQGGRNHSGDPEGDPADGTQNAGDPEGDPAEGDPAEGTENAGDPEGDPAEGTENAGDPEGDPAEGTENAGDPEGDPAEGTENAGDPEGDPADDGYSASGGRIDQQRGLRQPGTRGTGELVPFFLVVNTSLELVVPMAELGFTDLGPDEFLPIDLRVDVNRLLDEELVSDLDDEAAQILETAEEGFALLSLDPRDARAAFALDLDSAAQKTDERRHTGTRTLEISGDARDGDAR